MGLSPELRILLAIGFGILIGKALFDPPPPEELVEAIAHSEWARHLAEKFCGGTGEEREKCIETMSKYLAKRIMSSGFVS